MVFLPISGKLKTRTMDEIMNLEIIYHGTHSIMHGINPMMLHEKLLSYLPERDRKVIIVDGND